MLDGSPHWVFEQNIIVYGNICQAILPKLVLQQADDGARPFSLINFQPLLYFPRALFGLQSITSAQFTSSASTTQSVHPWPHVETIIARAHLHVRKHPHLSNIRMLLTCNRLWSDEAVDGTKKATTSSCGRRFTALPQPSIQIFFSFVNKTFNYFLWIYRVWFGGQCILHTRDNKNCFFSCAIYNFTSLPNTIYALRIRWLSLF